jgi:hypothetical protein
MHLYTQPLVARTRRAAEEIRRDLSAFFCPRRRFLFLTAFIVALLICVADTVRADFIASGPGSVISVSTNGNVVSLPAQKGGRILNTAPVTVYVGWDVPSVSADKTPGDNKTFLAPGDAVRIPARVSRFVIRTAGDGVGVVQYVEP